MIYQKLQLQTPAAPGKCSFDLSRPTACTECARLNQGKCSCRDLVTKTYCKANGYETDCEVIYGDTDSVMVHFKVPQVGRAMELGREAAEFVSRTFVKPIKLEFEKVLLLLLLCC